MGAADNLSDIQFTYDTPEFGESFTTHKLTAWHPSMLRTYGTMLWSSRGVRNVGVDPDVQRRGVATALWNEGQRMAAENARIPAPKHSNERTDAGDAWARAVGGRLPRRKR